MSASELPRTKTRNWNSKSFGYLLLAPAMLVVGAVRFYPLFQGVWLGFTDRSLLRFNEFNFIGLGNFVEIFTEEDFLGSLGFTFTYTFSVVALAYVTGLVLALMLNRSMKARGIFRTLLLIPWLIPPLVACTKVMWILNDRYGIVNLFLQRIGLLEKPIYFLSDLAVVRYTVIGTAIWRFFPFMMIILLAGLQSIPLELYECATVEGAGAFASFRHITLPLLRDVSFIATTLSMIWVINDFATPYFLTGGGPVNHTMTVPIYTYNMAFYRTELGYASAVAVIMSVIMLVLSVVNAKVTRGAQEQ